MSTPQNIESTVYEEEFKQLRRQASEKENHISLVKNELWKKKDEIQRLRDDFNETTAKFHAESNRVMDLETELGRCSEDLRSERFARENLQAALEAAKEKLNSEEQSRRKLELELEDYASRTTSQHEYDTKRLLSEKQHLESKLRAAEATLQEERLLRSSKADRSPAHVVDDHSSEQQIKELRLQLSTTERDLAEASRLLTIARKEADKVSRLQNELITAQNARMQAEKFVKDERAELKSIREQLQDQEEELQYWRVTFGDRSGETERMDEVVQEFDKVKKDLADSRARESSLKARLETMEVREVEIVMEKEEALNEVDRLREMCHSSATGSSADVEELRQMLKEKDAALRKARDYANELQQIYKETLTACDTAEARVGELEKQIQASKPDPLPLIVVSPPPSKTLPRKPFLAQPTHEITAQDEAAILRLLTAVDRLRSERDSLRRAVHFTSVEHRISLETIHAELADKNKEIATLNGDLETLREQLDSATTESTTELLKFKDEAEVWRRKCESLESEKEDDFRTNEVDLQIMQTHLGEVEANYQRSSCALKKWSRVGSVAFVLVQRLSDQLQSLRESFTREEQRCLEIVREKDEILSSLDALALEKATIGAQLADVMKEVETRDSRISSMHSEIQDLNIQVSNLQYEVKESQEELLSVRNDTSSGHIQDERDPAALLARINTLEQRVLRRTEQIGTLQHDSKRLETNLRLAEETIMELTGDLEDIKRERACLVDDCAHARKDRDNAFHRLEDIEGELEALQGIQANQAVLQESLAQAQAEIAEQTRTIESLVGVAFDSKTKLRLLASSHTDLSSQLEVLKNQTRSLEGQYAHSLAENERLTSRTDSMEVTLMEQTDDIDKWKQDLSSAQAEIDRLLKNLEELTEQHHTYEAEAIQQKRQHFATVESLRAELAQAQELLASTERDLESARKEEEKSRQLLHSLQESDNSNNAEVTRLNSIIHELQESIAKETVLHESSLASLRANFDKDRSRLESELEASGAAVSSLREEYEASIRGLEEKLAAGESLIQAAEAAKAHCEAEVERIRAEYAEEILALETRLEEETAAKISLEAELQGASDSVTELENHIAAAVSRYESEVRDMEISLSEARSQIDGQVETNGLLQREKAALELERARLEAELERASTKYQYADQQLKTSEHERRVFETDIQQLRAHATKLEEAAQAAEATLTLRTTQYEQRLASAQREVEKRLNHRQCEETMGELREKIEYLEEVLQMKSAEIEENDDRFIEVLKDKKRLQGKIDSLDRKYKASQTKSETLVAKNGELLHENSELLAKLNELSRSIDELQKKIDETAAVPKPVFDINSQPQTAVVSRPKTPSPPSTAPLLRPPTRIPSTPSSVLRAKTPERSQQRSSVPDLPAVPPFMAQHTRPNVVPSHTAPHLRSTQETNTPTSIRPPTTNAPSSSGRKRRLPDDFDSPARIPVQAIVASLENTTPQKSRRATGNDRGFTPTRRNQQPHFPSSPLPKREVVPLGESTNSPRDPIRSLGLGKPSLTSGVSSTGLSKGTTRSWLSKSRMLLGKDGRSVTTGGTRQHL